MVASRFYFQSRCGGIFVEKIKRANDPVEHDRAYMRVNDRGVYMGVSEKVLNYLEWDAFFQEVCGKGVPQGVRGDMFGDFGFYRGILHGFLDGGGMKRKSSMVILEEPDFLFNTNLFPQLKSG
jgi:hypothetical protein